MLESEYNVLNYNSTKNCLYTVYLFFFRVISRTRRIVQWHCY